MPEIFPKDRGPLLPGDTGNGLHLPYRGAAGNHAFDANGAPLTLDEFLAAVETQPSDAPAEVLGEPDLDAAADLLGLLCQRQSAGLVVAAHPLPKQLPRRGGRPHG